MEIDDIFCIQSMTKPIIIVAFMMLIEKGHFLLTMSDFDLEVYGNLSEQLQQAAAGLNPKVYQFHNGL